MAIAVIPILCLLLLTSEPIMDTFSEQLFSRFGAITADDIYTAGGHDIFENSAVVLLWLIVVPASLFIPPTAFGKLSDLATLGLLVVSLVLLMGTAVCLTWIFNKAARIVSHGLSLALNPLTVSQLKAAAYGSDMQEAFAVDTAEWPIWLSRGHPPLPAWIASDLEQASDNAISEVIPKFRNIIENLTEADSKQATADVLADYLTWKELIHTSYFDQDRFIKLVAYAIGQSRGFRSSPAFIRDDVPVCYCKASYCESGGGMRLKAHQWAELAGIFFLLASTGTQIFYVEPLRREIEWRLAAFNMQQNGQLQMKAIYDSRIALLRGLQSPESEIADIEAESKVMMGRYKNADANISDYLVAKEPVESRLQVAVVVLFAIGSLLAGFGRAMEMVAGHRLE